MITPKLSEVTSKGAEWFSGGYRNVRGPKNETPKTPDAPSKYNSTNTSNSTSPAIKWFIEGGHNISDQIPTSANEVYSTVTDFWTSVGNVGSNATQSVFQSLPSFQSVSESRHKQDEQAIWLSPRKYSFRRSKFLNSTHKNNRGLNIQYNSINGNHYNRSSLTAVRDLLVEMEDSDADGPLNAKWPTRKLGDGVTYNSEKSLDPHGSHLALPQFSYSEDNNDQDDSSKRKLVSKRCETASQLAEGTVRALRDIALFEAVELHQALRFWSIRWENPMLSLIEAGPIVWFSSNGYNHQKIGQKVSQIQAVLARRCAVIGELQQHLLRAGWQRGVAQWGVLGQGGLWTAIETVHENTVAARKIIPPMEKKHTVVSDDNCEMPTSPHPKIGTKDNNAPIYMAQRSGYYTNIFVRNKDDGEICMDDAALAEWSVDAMILIRKKLYRASNGCAPIPYEENWKNDRWEGAEDSFFLTVEPNSSNHLRRRLPIWASFSIPEESLGSKWDGINISNLPLMASEVSALLNIMEEIMHSQRLRKLQKLQPPTYLRRCWYLTAMIPPSVLYLMYHMTNNGYGRTMIKYGLAKITNFFQERIREPVLAIFAEIWKGRECLSDRKAHLETIKALKIMIRSWLDETYPDMPIPERDRIAEAMDVSLIENKKTESMKTIYEINNVVRMSLIEMQFIKKEMMNAMYAMDEVMAANDINMNLAAITPALALLYCVRQSFRFLFYALLRLGKSKEETYASFRHIITDIERLLVMRDNPPTYCSRGICGGDNAELQKTSALSIDDLGMIMVHIHECRTILWNDRRRFTSDSIRSVSEDLAELGGERGAVSIRQQLQIIQRMNRTYPFLKIIGVSSGFEFRHGIRY